MPKLTVEGIGEFEVPDGKRLVLALTDEAGIDQLHACGGNARCTTCRVEFTDGEPDQMTQAEKDLLAARHVMGMRLSCQIVCDHDMAVRVTSTVTSTGRQDRGGGRHSICKVTPVGLAGGQWGIVAVLNQRREPCRM